MKLSGNAHPVFLAATVYRGPAEKMTEQEIQWNGDGGFGPGSGPRLMSSILLSWIALESIPSAKSRNKTV